MNKEQIIEVIDKLVGDITPIGETNYDNKVKKNLEVMIEIVGDYVDEICEIAQTNSYMASIQDCQKIAEKFIRGLKDAYESLDSEVVAMNEFIEKLIGRLEEEKEYCSYNPKIRDEAINKAIEIVKQLAEEYNNGWIPCGERLPEENQRVLGCFAHGTVTELAFYDGLFHGIYAYNTKIIIAWMPLPEPFKPKGE